MEQKFTFKRLLSLLVVFTMLFGSFAALAVPAGAVDIYWAEGDYTIADGGNMTAANAYGYVFNIAGLNVAPNETNTIFTSDETWKTTNGWAVSVVLENIADDVYEVVTVYNAPAQNGDWKSYVTALTEDQIVMMAHSSGSRPNAAGDYSETATIDYANWQDKVAALALKAGDRITLAGVDLEAGTATEATATVQDAPIVVTGENGKWQADEGSFGFTYDYYTTKDNLVVIATLDGELVAANAEDTTGNGKATNVRLWVNYGAEKWDRLYDGYIKGDAAALYSKDSAGTEGTEGTVALNEKTFTFTLPLAELAGGNDEFQFTICVSNTTAYNEGNACLYAPCDTFAWSAWDAANAHTIVVATSEPEPDPEPDVPTESKNVALNKDYTISGCGTTYAQYTASLTDGAAKTTISYDANWFTFYNNGSDASIINAPGGIGYVIIDLTESYNVTTVKANVMDLQGASGIKGPKSVKAYLSADGETWGEAVELDLSAFVSASESFVAVANIEGEAQFVKVEFELDGIFAFVNEIEVYADVPVEEEPTPDPEVVPYIIPVGSINAYGWGNDGYPVILGYGEGKDVVATVGGAWFEWWFKVKAEWNETEGAFVVNATGASGNKDYEAWTLNANEIMFLVYSGTETYAAAKDIIAGLAVGDKLYASGFDFTNASANNLIVDGVSTVNFSNVEFEEEPTPEVPALPEGAIALDYAGYVHDSYFEILAADGKTVADLTTLGIGEAKDMNYFYVAVVGADNVITEMYTTLGRPDGVKSDVVCPEGGYIIGLNANKAGADALLAAKVGDSIVLYNVDVDSFRGAEGSIALENAGFAIVAAPEEPVIPGLPENITLWGSGAGVEVMTDGYTGVDEINTWEGNTDKLYGFSNSVLDAAEYSFDITIEETTFDAVTLYVLDFVNGGVTLPDAVSFVINDVWYEATINGNENNIGTIVVELDEAVTASTITVVVSMGVSPHTFAIFNMFTELEVNEYVPVTSNVVTDWNPTGYKASYGGATGAFIYDDADIYAACGNDWWIHVAFAPVADMDGYYEVVAVRAPTTGNYLTIPENGFVWMAWSSAADSEQGDPESAGAYALNFMSNLKVGDIVNFVGVDFANHTTETDAYAEVWVDPNAPVNVALNKDYTISGTADSTYNANLTDGNAYGGMSYDNKWFVFNTNSTVDGIGTAIIDLAGDYVISKVQVNLINESGSGVAKPEYVKFFVSADGEAWEELGEVALQDVQSAAYWTGIEDLDVTARYVKLEMKIGNPFSFLNEIEVYGKAAPAKVELVEGENEITVPALNSAIANTNFDKDLVITIAGQWDVTVIVNGVEYYPNRMGVLEAPLPAGENTVEFKNSAEADAAIVAVVAAPIVGDTMDDPIALDKDGDYTADVTDKYPEGVYYQYTATEDGTVTITINSEAGWLYVINNVTAGKYGDMHWSDDEEVVTSETIDVTAGDVIMIQVATYDPDNPWTAPIGTVDFTLDVPGEAAPETVEIALGDINMDGAVDQYDYILVRRQYFETIELNEVQLELADVNGDEKVDQYDYILVCRHYFETFVIEGTVAVPVEALPAE